ncbi:MAG: tetratricopeptide repeat protein [Pirellulales bacterium]|nr:tetratricopeptide repeat protein [Pirellulales bacterium]
MRCVGLRWMIAAAVLSLPAGCRLPGRGGPTSKSLAASRQLSQHGIAAAEQGQHEQAEALLAKAVKTCPNDPEARRHYAEALWRRGAQRASIQQLEEAAQLAPDDAMLRVRLAEMHLAAGQMERARQKAEEALDLNPRLPGAWVIRGRVMHAAGHHEQALADYHRCLVYAADNRNVLLSVAELYLQLDRPQAALATLQTLSEAFSPGEEPQEVLYLTGLACTALGRHRDGAECFAAAADRGRATPDVFYRLGEAEWFAGRPAEAAAAAQHALAIQPEHQPSRELLKRIELARLPGASPQR